MNEALHNDENQINNGSDVLKRSRELKDVGRLTEAQFRVASWLGHRIGNSKELWTNFKDIASGAGVSLAIVHEALAVLKTNGVADTITNHEHKSNGIIKYVLIRLGWDKDRRRKKQKKAVHRLKISGMKQDLLLVLYHYYTKAQQRPFTLPNTKLSKLAHTSASYAKITASRFNKLGWIRKFGPMHRRTEFTPRGLHLVREVQDLRKKHPSKVEQTSLGTFRAQKAYDMPKIHKAVDRSRVKAKVNPNRPLTVNEKRILGMLVYQSEMQKDVPIKHGCRMTDVRLGHLLNVRRVRVANRLQTMEQMGLIRKGGTPKNPVITVTDAGMKAWKQVKFAEATGVGTLPDHQRKVFIHIARLMDKRTGEMKIKNEQIARDISKNESADAVSGAIRGLVKRGVLVRKGGHFQTKVTRITDKGKALYNHMMKDAGREVALFQVNHNAHKSSAQPAKTSHKRAQVRTPHKQLHRPFHGRYAHQTSSSVNSSARSGVWERKASSSVQKRVPNLTNHHGRKSREHSNLTISSKAPKKFSLKGFEPYDVHAPVYPYEIIFKRIPGDAPLVPHRGDDELELKGHESNVFLHNCEAVQFFINHDHPNLIAMRTTIPDRKNPSVVKLIRRHKNIKVWNKRLTRHLNKYDDHASTKLMYVPGKNIDGTVVFDLNRVRGYFN